MLPSSMQVRNALRGFDLSNPETLDSIETACDCAVDTPQFAPGAAGFPGALVSERAGFAVGNFAISLGNSSIVSDTTVVISGSRSTATGNWGTDVNLGPYMNANGDYILFLRGSRVHVAIAAGGTPAQAAADLGTIATRGYLSHTPQATGIERRIRHLQSTFSAAWGEAGGLAVAADFGTARADARDTWSRPSWNVARPMNPYQDTISFLVPQTAVARSVVLELDGIAINTQSLPPGFLARMGRKAVLDFVLQRYPPLAQVWQFLQLARGGAAMTPASGT